MKNNQWKKTGLTVTRKLLYYALVLFVLIVLGSTAAHCLSAKDTVANLCGLILTAFAIGGFITVVLREVNYFTKNK